MPLENEFSNDNNTNKGEVFGSVKGKEYWDNANSKNKPYKELIPHTHDLETGKRIEEKLPPFKTNEEIDEDAAGHSGHLKEEFNIAMGGNPKTSELQDRERKQNDPAGAPKFHKDSNT